MGPASRVPKVVGVEPLSHNPQGGWGGSSASRPQGGWGGSGASATPGGWGGVTSSFSYPPSAPVLCHSAVPHPPPTSVTDGITTSAGSAFTTPYTVTPTIAHENWGKGSYTPTSVYPTAHTDHVLCPTGYTSYVNLPAGTQSGSSYSDPSPTSTSSVVPSPSSDPSPSTPPNPQNLNGNDKPTSAAVSSFKLSLVVTVLGTISAAALVI